MTSAEPTRGLRYAHLLCALAVALPLYGGSLFVSIAAGDKAMELGSPLDMLRQVLIMAAFFIGLVALLQTAVLRLPLAELNRGNGNVLTDILSGGGVLLTLLGAAMAAGLVARMFGFDALPEANRVVGEAIRDDTTMRAIMLGPLAWLQGGLIEELTRVFILSRLLTAFPSPRALVPVIILSSAAFGLGHVYQGFTGFAVTTLIGVLLAIWYVRQRRLLPLIIGHAVYDMLVMLALSVAVDMPL